MSEMWMGSVPAFGMLIIIAACFFYQWGGRNGKWKRRFIGSLLCATAIWVEALLLGRFHLLLLILYPLCIACFSLGYGADVLPLKIAKRSLVVITSLLSSGLMVYIYGGNTVWILPAEVLVASATVYLGVKNPIQAAPEEFFVCLFLWAPKLMYPLF